MNDLLSFLKLSILHVGYAKLDYSWNFKNVISPFVRLFFVTEGEAKANIANQSLSLESGNMYLIPSFTHNNYSCDHYHEQFYVGFFEEIRLGMSIFNFKRFKNQVKGTEEDLKLFKRLLEINPKKSVLDNNPRAHVNNMLTGYGKLKKAPLNIDIETQGILTILLSRFIENVDLISNNVNSKGGFNEILEYISKHLSEELTVKFLAEYCGLSSDHFSRLFYSKFEIKPSKYIQMKRIERAQFLLLTTKDSLEQVAHNVGMSNMSYFSRKFKEFVGFSPAAFRKKQMNY